MKLITVGIVELVSCAPKHHNLGHSRIRLTDTATHAIDHITFPAGYVFISHACIIMKWNWIQHRKMKENPQNRIAPKSLFHPVNESNKMLQNKYRHPEEYSVFSDVDFPLRWLEFERKDIFWMRCVGFDNLSLFAGVWALDKMDVVHWNWWYDNHLQFGAFTFQKNSERFAIGGFEDVRYKVPGTLLLQKYVCFFTNSPCC